MIDPNALRGLLVSLARAVGKGAPSSLRVGDGVARKEPVGRQSTIRAWKPWGRWSAAIVGAVALTLVSCDSSDTSRSAPAPTSAEKDASTAKLNRSDLSATQTVKQVHEYRLSGRLSLLESHLLAEQRPFVIELIQAVDRLVGANEVLKEAVGRHLGPASAGGFDRSQLANAIGVLSRDVEVLDERIEGDTAKVTIQVAGRVPLDEVRLVRQDERWVIKTDPPIPGVAEEVRRLADALIDTARMLDKQPMTAMELKKELDLREASIGRRLTELTKKPPE